MKSDPYTIGFIVSQEEGDRVRLGHDRRKPQSLLYTFATQISQARYIIRVQEILLPNPQALDVSH